jgi:hypothetical protein
MDGSSPKTEELLAEEIQREQAERERADTASTPDEEHAARRRAERAEFLQERLREQAASEDG